MIYNDIALFVSVAEHLNFSEAAHQNGIPPSRISRRIAGLEAYLGVKLFERSTRQVRLTAEGKAFLDQCQNPIDDLRQLTNFKDQTTVKTIRITAPPLAVRTNIGPKLLEFIKQYPDIKIDLSTTNMMLDFFRDNIDLAFRLGPLHDSQLIAKQLWSVPYCFCASRNFIKLHDLKTPLSLTILRHLPAIISRQAWILENGEKIVPQNIIHEFDDLFLIAEAARNNMGIAMLPKDMLNQDLITIPVINAQPLQRHMYAVYPSRRLLPQRIRDMINFMIQA